jgi:hypothetical protein
MDDGQILAIEAYWEKTGGERTRPVRWSQSLLTR